MQTDKQEDARIGDCFQTFTGNPFYPLDPRPYDIDINDIAQALSNICRFGGQCHEFYSVAQHSVLVSNIVPVEFALEGLLHDAAEAYVGDMVKPLKTHMPEYVKAEDLVYAAVAARFSLPPKISPEVKAADVVALATEARDLMHWSRPCWHKWIAHVSPLTKRIIPMTPSEARVAFILRFEELLFRN